MFSLFHSRPIGPAIRERTRMRPLQTAPRMRYASGGQIEGTEAPDDARRNMHDALEDMINAFHSKDVQGAVEAFKTAFLLLEQQPHEEYGDEDAANSIR